MDPKYFKRRSDVVSFFIVVSHMALVMAPLYINAVLGFGIHTLFCWLFFGVSMNGLVNLMHETSHYLVFREKRGSEILGRYILAPMVFADFYSYQQRHWAHHKYLGVEGETKDAYHIDIHGTHIGILLLRCLTGLEAFSKILKNFTSPEEKDNYKASKGWILRVLLFQTIFFLSLVLSAYGIGQHSFETSLYYGGLTYGIVYFYGLMSLTTFMADLRAIAEHQFVDEHDTTEGEASLRNFKCNLISRFLFGAYGFGEHYTHHKVPGIPYYSLPETTDVLAKEDAAMEPTESYFSILFKIIKKSETAPH